MRKLFILASILWSVGCGRSHSKPDQKAKASEANSDVAPKAELQAEKLIAAAALSLRKAEITDDQVTAIVTAGETAAKEFEDAQHPASLSVDEEVVVISAMFSQGSKELALKSSTIGPQAASVIWSGIQDVLVGDRHSVSAAVISTAGKAGTNVGDFAHAFFRYAALKGGSEEIGKLLQALHNSAELKTLLGDDEKARVLAQELVAGVTSGVAQAQSSQARPTVAATDLIAKVILPAATGPAALQLYAELQTSMEPALRASGIDASQGVLDQIFSDVIAQSVAVSAITSEVAKSLKVMRPRQTIYTGRVCNECPGTSVFGNCLVNGVLQRVGVPPLSCITCETGTPLYCGAPGVPGTEVSCNNTNGTLELVHKCSSPKPSTSVAADPPPVVSPSATPTPTPTLSPPGPANTVF